MRKRTARAVDAEEARRGDADEAAAHRHRMETGTVALAPALCCKQRAKQNAPALAAEGALVR